MILAFLLQRITVIVPSLSFMAELNKAALILSYVIILATLSLNLHLWSLRFIGLGVALNFAAILANGGLMPTSHQASLPVPSVRATAGYSFSRLLFGSPWVSSPIDQARLQFLSDIIRISWMHMVISPGDVIIGIGLLIFLVEVVKGKASISSQCTNQVRGMTNG
jgi:hypothetical protein